MTRLRWLIPLISVVILATAVSSRAGVFVSVAVGPPALPVYVQPIAPGPGYIWTPGYWAWSPDGYYWVPGTWVLPPEVGFLWTPGYWGFSAGLYNWHPGFWGPTVGFYGGINYGFGYPGHGYYGGYWRGRDFYYNRAVNNVNINTVHNVYNQTVVNNVNVNRVSYNGGPHGIQARPTSEQLAAERGQHFAVTAAQAQHEQLARHDRAQLASVNHGRPVVTATPRPGAFNNSGAAQMNRPEAAPNATRAAHEVPRPPQNSQQAHVQNNNVPRPPQNNSEHAQNPTQKNVPRPPQNNQQTRAAENVPRPANNVHQPAEQPSHHENNAAPSHPSTTANNRQAPAPQQHVAARPPVAQHTSPTQQARHMNPPAYQRAPQVYTAAHPPQQMTQRPMSAAHSQPQRQTAVHPSQPQSGHQQQRPH